MTKARSRNSTRRHRRMFPMAKGGKRIADAPTGVIAKRSFMGGSRTMECTNYVFANLPRPFRINARRPSPSASGQPAFWCVDALQRAWCTAPADRATNNKNKVEMSLRLTTLLHPHIVQPGSPTREPSSSPRLPCSEEGDDSWRVLAQCGQARQSEQSFSPHHQRPSCPPGHCF